MLGRLMPREGRFFELFNQHADRIVLGAHHLVQLMQHYGDPGTRQRELDAIDEIETSADRITHETVSLLHKTFITPFDREDIHQLISQMDDILDLTQDVAESVMLYDIQAVTPEAIQLAQLSQMCCERVRNAVGMLSSMDNAAPILRLCTEIDQLESDADRVMRSAMSKLFRDEADVRQVIKLKAIYELLESLTDKCEDVANVIEGVVLENA
jgi:predicted phosphate transport protein (TIGR00153 family)